MALTMILCHLYVYDGRKSHEFPKIQNGNIPYVVQNERYVSSGYFVLIFFARESIVSVISPFLQLQRQKNGCQILYHGDHLASGTPFIRPVQYDRMFLDSAQYGNILHVFTKANSRERFPGYIINSNNTSADL